MACLDPKNAPLTQEMQDQDRTSATAPKPRLHQRWRDACNPTAFRPAWHKRKV